MRRSENMQSQTQRAGRHRRDPLVSTASLRAPSAVSCSADGVSTMFAVCATHRDRQARACVCNLRELKWFSSASTVPTVPLANAPMSVLGKRRGADADVGNADRCVYISKTEPTLTAGNQGLRCCPLRHVQQAEQLRSSTIVS